MEEITSRKNPHIRFLRELNSGRAERRRAGLMLCAGDKLYKEARQSKCAIHEVYIPEGCEKHYDGDSVYILPKDLLQYVSPLENNPGPVFTVSVPKIIVPESPKQVIVLENIQDPGNTGTVLRTAAALGMDAVILVGSCADPYSPKAVRASMGAAFRQTVLEYTLEELQNKITEWKLPLYAAALSPRAVDLRSVSLDKAAVAIGNEGNGLSKEMITIADRELIIPMEPGSESFNAAIAASIFMWELRRSR